MCAVDPQVTGGLTLDHRLHCLSGNWPGPVAPPAARAFGGLTLRDARMPASQATSPTSWLVRLDLC